MDTFKNQSEEENKSNSNPSGAANSKTDGFAKTSLVFHPDWELTNPERYAYMYQHQKLPLLMPNQFSIDGIKLLNYNEGFVVVAFLRNTTDQPITIKALDLVLLNEEGNAVAKRKFELDTMGELPRYSCMPWRFLFEEKDRLGEALPKEGWSIAFEIKESPDEEQHRLDLHPNWEKQLPQSHKEQLKKIVSELPKLGPNDLNIMGYNAEMSHDGKLGVTVFIRNGSSKEFQFEQIPLAVEDATGEVVAKGGFKLVDFKVSPNSTRPWTFIFPKELLKKDNPDLSSWKVFMPQGQ